MPPAQPGSRYPGPVPPSQAAFGPQPPSPRRGGSGLLIALVVVLVLAVGGGAFALVSALTSHKTTAQPPSQPTSGAPATPSSGGESQTATPSASATSTTPAGVTVAVEPSAAGNPAAPQVQALLVSYFTAINDHDYAAYSSIHVAKAQMSYATFMSGYGSTTDSAEELTAISDVQPGELAATVAFTSHQDQGKSINGSTCTKWQIMLYLVPNGNSYLITSTPPSYHAIYMNC
jgi:hypothetical protein